MSSDRDREVHIAVYRSVIHRWMASDAPRKRILAEKVRHITGSKSSAGHGGVMCGLAAWRLRGMRLPSLRALTRRLVRAATERRS